MRHLLNTLYVMTEDAWLEAVRGMTRDMHAFYSGARGPHDEYDECLKNPAIVLVPERFRTERVCLAAMEAPEVDRHVYAGLDLVPEAVRTEAVCMWKQQSSTMISMEPTESMELRNHLTGMH